MNEQFYERLSHPFRRTKRREKMFRLGSRLLTILVYLAYPIALLVFYLTRRQEFFMAVLVPLVSFCLLSVFRAVYDAPRPYEELRIDPITKKDTKGKSFPSRHVFSAFLIAGVIWSLSKVFGIFYFMIGVCIAASRVIGGVHYPKDVLAGGIAGILFWFIGQRFFLTIFLQS